MAAAAAALLDELMGRNRNAVGSENGDKLRWDDAQVCRWFLCGYCPHDLFTNTRADLGPCNKIHDEVLRQEYQQSSKFEKLGYEEEWIKYLDATVADVDKRIKRGHARLAMTQEGEDRGGGGVTGPKQEQIMQLTDKIDDLVDKAEKLGCEGKVEEAQGVMKLCEQLRRERQQLENSENRDGVPVAKQMEVCPVCGAFLIVGDAESRQKEHLLGKQHMGYAQLRATVSDFQERKRKRIETERAERDKAREDERKQREKEREALKRRSSDQRRSRSRDRRRSSRDDSRRSSRDRRKSRSRSRDRRRSRDRKRSRSGERRHPSRDRRSSREREKRSRSRGRRSRSRDRKSRSDRPSSKDRARRTSKEDRSRRSSKEDRSRRSRSKEDKSHARSKDKGDSNNRKEQKPDKESNGHKEDGEDKTPSIQQAGELESVEMSEAGNDSQQ